MSVSEGTSPGLIKIIFKNTFFIMLGSLVLKALNSSSGFILSVTWGTSGLGNTRLYWLLLGSFKFSLSLG